MPQVSVIVPVYNAEKYLAECVDSFDLSPRIYIKITQRPNDARVNIQKTV